MTVDSEVITAIFPGDPSLLHFESKPGQFLLEGLLHHLKMRKLFDFLVIEECFGGYPSKGNVFFIVRHFDFHLCRGGGDIMLGRR